MDQEENLEIMFLKFSSVNTHSGFLKSTVYDAFVSSSVITGLKKDEAFNDLATAYTDIKFMQSAFGIVLTDFEIKLRIHNHALQKYGKDEYAKQILEDLSNKMKNNAGKELAIAYRSICKAIGTFSKYLQTMGINLDKEENADHLLTDEDNKFLKNILRKSPDKVPNNLFG